MAVYRQKTPQGEETWRVDLTWVDPTTGGKRRIRRSAYDEKQRPCQSKTAAQACEQRIRAQLLAGTFEVEPVKNTPEEVLTFSGFRERFFREKVAKLKASTRTAHATIWSVSLEPVIGDVPLKDIDAGHVAKIGAALIEKGRSAKTVNCALSALRIALTCAHDWGLRGEPPKIKWTKLPEKEVKWLTDDDLAKLVAVGDPMVTLAAKTGLRLGELVALTWADIDLQRRQVTVSKSTWIEKGEAYVGSTKSGRIRVVPLPTSAVEALDGLTRGAPTDLVFHRGGKPIPKGTSKSILWRACDKAGLPRCGWHRLRHSYISALVRLNVPLPQVQRLAGHSQIQMTMRYTHVAADDLVRAVSLLK